MHLSSGSVNKLLLKAAARASEAFSRYVRSIPWQIWVGKPIMTLHKHHPNCRNPHLAALSHFFTTHHNAVQLFTIMVKIYTQASVTAYPEQQYFQPSLPYLFTLLFSVHKHTSSRRRHIFHTPPYHTRIYARLIEIQWLETHIYRA